MASDSAKSPMERQTSPHLFWNQSRFSFFHSNLSSRWKKSRAPLRLMDLIGKKHQSLEKSFDAPEPVFGPFIADSRISQVKRIISPGAIRSLRRPGPLGRATNIEPPLSKTSSGLMALPRHTAKANQSLPLGRLVLADGEFLEQPLPRQPEKQNALYTVDPQKILKQIPHRPDPGSSAQELHDFAPGAFGVHG